MSNTSKPSVGRQLTAALAAAAPVAAASAMTGQSALATATGFIAAAAQDLASRQLSPRQRDRVERVAAMASRRMEALQAAGDSLRDDDFFTAGTRWASSFDELAEGVLLAAENEYEELKLPYLANLLANLAFSRNVDRSAGHWALRTAQELRWTQYVCLRLAEGSLTGDLPDPVVGVNSGTWESWTVHADLLSIGPRRLDLIQPREQTGQRTFPRPRPRLGEFELTSGGRLLCELMELGKMPMAEVVELLNRLQLRRPDRPEAQESPA